MSVTGYTQAGAVAALSSMKAVDAWATVEQNGTSIIARKTSDGSVVSSGTDASTVINATITAANTAGGGLIRLSHAVYLCTSTITILDGTGLIGSVTFWEGPTFTSVPVGSVLKSSGIASSRGVVEINGKGGCLQGIGVHGNGYQAIGVRVIGGNQTTIRDCVVTHGYHNITVEGTAGAFYDTNILNCMLWDAAHYGIKVTGISDGMISASRIAYSHDVSVSLGGGGWIMHGCHSTHDGTNTTTNLDVTGSVCTITGNYLDSAHAGPVVHLNTSGTTLVGNYIRNLDTSGMMGISLDGAFGSNIANNTVQTNAGTSMKWVTGALPVSGVYGPNFFLGGGAYLDSSGTAVANASTASLYVAGNVHTG